MVRRSRTRTINGTIWGKPTTKTTVRRRGTKHMWREFRPLDRTFAVWRRQFHLGRSTVSWGLHKA